MASQVGIRLTEGGRILQGHVKRDIMREAKCRKPTHKEKKANVRRRRARAASSKTIRESVQSQFDDKLRDAVCSIAPVRRIRRAAPGT